MPKLNKKIISGLVVSISACCLSAAYAQSSPYAIPAPRKPPAQSPAQSAPTQSQNNPYDFKGAQLGMSVDQFLARHPICVPVETVPPSRYPVCKQPSDWITYRNEKNSLLDKPTMNGFVFASYLAAIAEVPTNVNVNLAFAQGKLIAISLDEITTVLDAKMVQVLTNKFGPPTAQVTPRNAYAGVAVFWENQNSIAEFEHHHCGAAFYAYETDPRAWNEDVSEATAKQFCESVLDVVDTTYAHVLCVYKPLANAFAQVLGTLPTSK